MPRVKRMRVNVKGVMIMTARTLDVTQPVTVMLEKAEGDVAARARMVMRERSITRVTILTSPADRVYVEQAQPVDEDICELITELVFQKLWYVF